VSTEVDTLHQSAEKHWRRLDRQELILLIRAGMKFVDGKRVEREDEAKKAEKKGRKVAA
jgi:hypothetical protein